MSGRLLAERSSCDKPSPYHSTSFEDSNNVVFPSLVPHVFNYHGPLNGNTSELLLATILPVTLARCHPCSKLARFRYSAKCALCVFAVQPLFAHPSQLTSSLPSLPRFARWQCCRGNFCSIWFKYCFIHVCLMVCMSYVEGWLRKLNEKSPRNVRVLRNHPLYTQ